MTDLDLENLRAVLREELAGMQTDVLALRNNVVALEGKINAWPDLHFLLAAARQQVGEASEAREFRRYVAIKLASPRCGKSVPRMPPACPPGPPIPGRGDKLA